MGIFGGKENKEEKKARKAEELLSRYGLEDIADEKDLRTVKAIALDLVGNNLITLGTTLTGKAEDVAKLTYLDALVEQNWIVIRQLDRIAKLLEKD